jgi:metal-dependent hydrolase (beta-lactamase superfamily II)
MTRLALLIALAWSGALAPCSAAEPRAAADPAAARITVLFDAFGAEAGLTKDWGYSALVEAGGKRILFDTGNDPAILTKNARAKGVDLTRLDFARKIDPHIHLIAGGLHLVVAEDAAIAKVVSALHDTYKVDFIAPGHCTGEPAFAALRKAFGEHYLYAGLGTTFTAAALR